MRTKDIVPGVEYYVSPRPEQYAYVTSADDMTHHRHLVLATGVRATRLAEAEETPRVIKVDGRTFKVPGVTFHYRRYGRTPLNNGVLVAKKVGRTWDYEIVPAKNVRAPWAEYVEVVNEAHKRRTAGVEAAKQRYALLLSRVKDAFGLTPGKKVPANAPDCLRDLYWLANYPGKGDGSIAKRAAEQIDDLLWAYEKGRAS